MSKTLPMIAAAVLLAGPALAESHASGDAAAGEDGFSKCQACHVVTDDEGNTLAGRNGRTGPNLYGLPGRAAGSVEDFRYSSSMVEAGEAGLSWDEDSFVAYVQDPTGFLRDHLDDAKARSKMSFKLRDEEEARNLWAYLVSVSPEVEMDDAEDMTDTEEGTATN